MGTLLVSVVVRMSPKMSLSSDKFLVFYDLDSLRVAGQVICQLCLSSYSCFLTVSLSP